MAKQETRSFAWSGKAPFAQTDEKGNPLGVQVPPNASAEEMLIAARLNWEVLKEPNFMQVPVPDGDDRMVKVDDSYHLRRGDTHDILTPYVGSRYKPVQNADAFEIFTDFVRKGDMTMETAGSLGDGSTIWAMANIKAGFRLEGGDEVRGYLLLSQSHKYGNSMRVNFTPVRVTGFTTYMEAIKGTAGNFKMPHSKRFNEQQIEKIKATLRVAKGLLGDFQRKAEYLSYMAISERDLVRLFMHVFQPNLLGILEMEERNLKQKRVPVTLEEMAALENANRDLRMVPALYRSTPGIDMPSCRGTYWGPVCAIMYYFDHIYGRTPSTRLESSWFGKNSGAKIRALETAYYMANHGGVIPAGKKDMAEAE